MARPLRFEFEGALYHVFSRGNEKGKTFLDRYDCDEFLRLLQEASRRFSARILAYCLMPNHFHLLVLTEKPNLSSFMHWLVGTYTVKFNWRHGRVGHLFQGRFKAPLVDSDSYLHEVSRYIHLNPCWARLAPLPEDYEWSSMREYLGSTSRRIASVDSILKRFDSLHSYRSFVIERLENEFDLLSEVRAGAFLGSQEFAERMKRRVENEISPEVPFNRELQTVQLEVLRPILDGLPRPLTYYALWKWSSLTQREIGELFEVSNSAVSQAVRRVEARAALDPELERRIRDLASKCQMSRPDPSRG